MLSHLIESRNAAEPGSGHLVDPALSALLGWTEPTASGQAVTAQTALQASAVFACVRNTAETIAALPCTLRRLSRDEDGRRRTEDAVAHPLYSVLLNSPNDWQTTFDYWAMGVEHLQLRSNHYTRIIRSGAGRTVALEPLQPDGSANARQIVDLDDRRAVALLEGGYAEAVNAESETATVSVPAWAVTRGRVVSAGAQKLAAQHGIDLADIADTGTDGRITVPDVRRYLKTKEK